MISQKSNNMKKLSILFILLALCATTLFAQAPERFSYQAVVRNASNQLVVNTQVSVRVSILQESTDGKAVYVETHTASTSANGLLTVEIGGGKAEQGDFAGIDWANGPYFLKTETDPNGGSDYSVTITQQLLSVPYALYAREAGNSFSGDYNDLKNKPIIPQNVGELTNDAGYITLNDILTQLKGGGVANDAGVVQTTNCGEIDLCELDSRLTSMEAALFPTVTTGAVSNVTETTASCGGTVTDKGYSAVTARGVCWGTEPNPTVDGIHTSDSTGTGTFTSSITGLIANTTYYVRAYATNSVGTAYGEEVNFTTEEHDICTIISLPYSEDFEDHTPSATAESGVQLPCWEVVQEDVALTDATRPQVYYNSTYATSGDYTLRMKNRCVFAMPKLNDEINLSELTMTFNLRQPKAVYRLQVGVVNDNGVFELVKTINNASTVTEAITVDFSNYTGSGKRIAFRNTLSSSSTLDYSINYIDDIVLNYSLEPCGITALPYTENFDAFTTSTTAETGVQPRCWEVVTEDVALSDATKPQVYYNNSYATSGNYTLRMKNRCIYAMPELNEETNVSGLTMTFKLRQPKAVYRLQVGVVNDNGVFELVKTINNASTETESITVDFSNYTGSGHRIAFRNTVSASSTLDYSINYIDDITLDF